MSNVDFKDNSAEVLAALKNAKKRGLEDIGMTAEGYAKEELYPGHGKDTGHLQNSIANAVKDDAVYIGTNVEYGPYVELGTRNMEGIHYLKKAATEHAAEYKALMEASMKNA